MAASLPIPSHRFTILKLSSLGPRQMTRLNGSPLASRRRQSGRSGQNNIAEETPREVSMGKDVAGSDVVRNDTRIESEVSNEQSPTIVRKITVSDNKPLLRRVITEVEELRERRQESAKHGHEVALVPTMGALHAGHLELIKAAARHSSHVCVSIYVNPTQFGPNEDLDTYPRTLQADLKKLQDLEEELKKVNLEEVKYGRIAYVFAPPTSEMYPFGLENTSHVIVNPQVTQILEGKARPTFFQGVTTVVMKLLHIVQPERVWFGQKDIQQLIVIQRMVREFHMNLKIHALGTSRGSDGLALSSRNAHLGARRREVAPTLYRALRAAENFWKDSGPNCTRSEILGRALQFSKTKQDEQHALAPGRRARFELEYFSLADPVTLEEVDKVGPDGAILSGAMIMLPLEAVQLGEELGTDRDTNKVRLIDNILLGLPYEPPANQEDNLGLKDFGIKRPPKVSGLQRLIHRPSFGP